MTDIVFAVDAGGQETFLCQAKDKKTALKQALQEWGITTKTACELQASVREAKGGEVVRYCRSVGAPMEFLIRHPDYGEHRAVALCRMDAVMQAANNWDVECTPELQKKCTLFISRRITV